MKVPKPRRPGQAGNPFGQGANAAAFNARQKKRKTSGLMGCAVLGIIVGTVAGIGASVVTFGIAVLIL